MAARNVVLVHGLYCDASCWTDVIGPLLDRGLNVTAVQNSLKNFGEALADTRRVLARQEGPTVLVGHSFGGMIVTEAGADPGVSALVYVAARAPDAVEDYRAMAEAYGPPPVSAGIVYDGDEARLTKAAFLNDLVGDVPPARARLLYATQAPFHRSLLAAKTAQAAWRSKPSFYAVSAKDRAILPDLQRFMAKRMGAETVELEAGHFSPITHSDEICDLIVKATHVPLP
ncbi:pimeloyl-ACP methyl ester carboxylesterase [Sphingomonas vulcanisoli]|uniref:Pimeloyl-ACP methyl ester carboxylesterase n=1 Tax=Sphingomonas vulcanisoli TaxID=1658060 RepID=A0ABX0TTZ9_9SPHN|nr:alpha/beta hydrolase [Sphingomonas vulcanisoli]NIJ08204.1 pimeloyl-ACP methyl ester carboxylesterase [Sphingomonas vulcanisoli]